MLAAKEPYVKESKPLTANKERDVSFRARREVPDAVSNRSSIASLTKGISRHADTLARYPKDMEEFLGGSSDELEREGDLQVYIDFHGRPMGRWNASSGRSR